MYSVVSITFGIHVFTGLHVYLYMYVCWFSNTVTLINPNSLVPVAYKKLI